MGWIKEWSHEKDENNHGVHTKRTQPEGAHHIENTAFQSCTLNNQHSQLFHVVHRQISSHNRVNDFCQNVHTNSFSYHWHCILFCDGTAVSQAVTRLSLWTPLSRCHTRSGHQFWAPTSHQPLSLSMFCSTSLPSQIVALLLHPNSPFDRLFGCAL